ncbi:MAG: hypothetical protein IPP71_08785 [Bacteroidetes bacterium]|nr:hypothetical protein [Bacteroidota bacterium]
MIINSGGNLISDQAITVSGAFSMTGTAIYTHNNISNAAVTIFSGAESFSATSTLVIDKWSSFTTPLPNGVTGNFGNLTFNTTGSWSQNGLFAPNRIKGTLAITNGSIIMDNGTGMSTSLTLQDVAISGSGCLVVQSGTPRNLTLITGNFTDVSTSTNYTYMMYRSVGNFDWTVNGNLNVNHRFTAIEGTSAANVGSAVIHVTGDFTIGGGLFTGLKQVTGSINMTVDGASLITGGPSLVAFKDYYIGDVTFNSGSLAIDNSRNTYFLGTHSTVGAVTINITGDFSISGASTRVYYAVNDASFNDIFVTIGNDLILTDALLSATNGGIVNYSIGRNYTQTGATSNFRGQYSSVNAGNVDMTINGSMTINGGLFTQSRTTGSVSLNVTEVIDVQNATFYGMNNTTLGNNGIGTLSCTDLSISASTFDFYRGVVLDGRTIPINISNQLSINFTNAAQRVYFISRAGDNNAVLDLNIGTNFYVTGTADGLFCSSMSTGMEDISIGNDFSVSGGRARFNAFENASARGHTTTGSVGGSVLLSGGSIAFSSHVGTTNWTITGDFDQTGGIQFANGIQVLLISMYWVILA